MGHMVGKDVYRRLGRKVDGLSMRAPWNKTLHSILKELYTADEADLVVKMPYGMAGLDKIAKVTGIPKDKLQKLLDSLCSKGLVLDIGAGGRYRYTVSPFIVGIFEFTMMRTRGELQTKDWAKLFYEYLQQPETFYKSNAGDDQRVLPLRALPHEGTVEESEYVEVLDFEKATSIVEDARKFAIGICSCRHEKLHVGQKPCDIPLEKCSTFGASADYMIRHDFAREVSKTEMLENLAESRESGLVFCADNVRRNISFICHCCGCCCNVLLGVSRFGYPNTVVTSNYLAKIDSEACSQCGICVEACPVKAISMANGNGPLPMAKASQDESPGDPVIDEEICIGCGVCSLECSTESLKLVKRQKRVLYPEDTFERAILQSLERGTLQNLLFDNPQSKSHGFLRAFVGGFLKLPPVKKSLMSDRLRSRFLNFIRQGA